MLESLVYNFGYFGLFIVSFLASTLLPVGSEVFVVLMVSSKYNIWLILLFATFGNYFGALTNYFIGKYGNKFILSKYIKFDQKSKEKAENLYSKWGSPTLLLSWLPVIGDPMCLIPGIMNLDIRVFSIWVFLGKLIRYMFVIYTTQALLK